MNILYKNVASQKAMVIGWDTTTDPWSRLTGDAANITANISKDGGAEAGTNDTNPTEIGSDGKYLFDLTQAETNADLITIDASSTTANTLFLPVEYRTIPGDNAALAADAILVSGATPPTVQDHADAIVSDGNPIHATSGTIDHVTLVDQVTTNTDMRGTDSALLAASAPSNFGDLSISASTGLVSLAADQSGVTIGTVTTNTDMRGTDNALLAASAPANFGDLSISASTGLVSLAADQSSVTIGTVTTVTTTTTASSVTAIGAGGITAASFAANAVDASALATDAVNEIRDSILSDSTAFAGANIDGTITSRATPAQVNAQVLDVLNVDTFAEPSSIPGATTTIVNMVHLLYSMVRNKKTETATTTTLRNDADGADIGTSSISYDGTTYTAGEWT